MAINRGSIAATELAKLGKCDLLIKSPLIDKNIKPDSGSKNEQNCEVFNSQRHSDENKTDNGHYQTPEFKWKARNITLVFCFVVLVVMVLFI